MVHDTLLVSVSQRRASTTDFSCPLSLVYRVFDIIFAEGIEALFRFSLALLKQAESRLVEMDFEQLLKYLQMDIFEQYLEETGRFVQDAYEFRM